MDKNKSVIIISLLVVIIFVLAIFMAVIITKYDNLEDKYDDRYDNELNVDNPTNEDNYISKDRALEIVLNDLKITKNDIYDLDIEFENKHRYDGIVIEISFDYNRYEYEYYLDATNGNILDSFKSRD